MEDLAPATDINAEVAPQAESPQQPSDAGTGAPAPETQQGSESNEQDDAAKASEAARTLSERAQRNRENAARRVAEERDSYRKLAEMAISALQRGQQPAQQTPQQPDAPAAPKREDFNSYDEWVEAKATYAAERRADAILQQRMQQAAEQYQRQAQEQFARRVDNEHFARAQQFAKQTPDFAEVTDREDVIVPQAASEAIKRMPDGPAILYAFGQDPNLVSAMHNMDPAEQMIHLGRLSAFLRSQSTSRLSNAAPAGRTVGAKPSGGTSLPDDTEAYMAAANKKFGRR